MVENMGGVEEHRENDSCVVILQNEGRNGLQLGVHTDCKLEGK